MLNQLLKTCCCLVLLLTVTLKMPAQAADMRGFGAVQQTKLPGGAGVQFACDSPAHATLLIHKLAHDMAQSVTVPAKWVTLTLAGRSVPVLVRPGLGAYLVLAKGNTAYCFTAPLNAGQAEGDLGTAFAAAIPLLPDSQLYDTSYTYPFYLDKWSDKGMGTWYSPYDPFDDDPKGLTDVVTPHFKYLTEHGLAVHLGDGMGRDETMYFIHKYNRPFHMSRWHKWDNDLARLNPFDLIMPGKLFTSTATYYGQLSDGGQKLEQYRNWDFQNFMKPYVNDPNLVDWDEPHGEIGPGPWQYTWDFGEENRAHFAQWLQTEKHYSLASLGQAWHHDPNYFTNWSKVPIPYDYALFGAGKDSVFADRTWRIHSADLMPGIAAGFARSSFDDDRWYSMQMPGGEVNALFEYIRKPFWYRGTVTVSPAYLASHKGPLYLNVASLTQAYGPHAPEHVWLNGVDLGGLTAAGGWYISGSKIVTGLLHAGINHIAYCPVSQYIPGGFFLSTKPMEVYPYADSGLNARYVDWFNYTAAMTIDKAHHTIQALRGLDPNRPFKQMAVNGGRGVDISSALKFPGPNVLVIASNWDGYNGAPDIWRQPTPESILSLAGSWNVRVDEDHGTQKAILPGSFNGMFATKMVVVPAAWSKSHVFLRLTGSSIRFLGINYKLMFFDTPWPEYMDITPWIKFGQPNRVFVESNAMQDWQPGNVTISSAQLEQVTHL